MNKLIFVILTIAFGMAQAKDKIYATQLDGLCEEGGAGIYDKVFKEIKTSYKVLPPSRAEANMKAEKACLFPVDQRFIKSEVPLIQSNEIQTVNIFIFSNDKIYSSLADLKGKKVGLRFGLNYGPVVEGAVNTFTKDEAPSLDSSIKKLLAGRVDAIIEFDADVLDYLKKNKVALKYNSSSPVDKHNDAITCIKSSENEALINSFNENLKKHAAQIKKILGE